MIKYVRASDAAEAISNSFNIPLYDMIDVFAEVKPADVTEIKHGKWSDQMVSCDSPNGDMHFGYKCSVCGGIYNKTDFCGGCGARMEVDNG